MCAGGRHGVSQGGRAGRTPQGASAGTWAPGHPSCGIHIHILPSHSILCPYQRSATSPIDTRPSEKMTYDAAPNTHILRPRL